MKRALTICVGLLAIGCKPPPPEAPTKLEDLCGYVFEHGWDEDTAELEAGLYNLDTWLNTGSNLESTIEGYQISAMTQESVEAIDNGESSVADLVGASVAHRSAYSPSDITRGLVIADQMEVFPKNYKAYEREFSEDPVCFPGIDCEDIEADAESESSWAGLVKVWSENHIQYRWIDVEDVGWVMVHRSWLKKPAEISWEEIKVHAQYFMSVTIPQSGGEAVRLQATWIDAEYGVLPVSEDYAKKQVVNSMQNQGEDLEEWLAAN